MQVQISGLSFENNADPVNPPEERMGASLHCEADAQVVGADLRIRSGGPANVYGAW